MAISRSAEIINLVSHSKMESQWYAIYTKARAEKVVLRSLLMKGIEAYLPLISKIKKHSKRIKKYEVPLINSYLFVNIGLGQVNQVLETEYVSKFIKHSGKLAAIPEEEILVLKRIVGDIEDVEAAPVGFNIGDEVEIFSGHLSGIKGRLVSKAGKKNFIVELDHIGIQLTMDISVSQLRRIKKAV